MAASLRHGHWQRALHLSPLLAQYWLRSRRYHARAVKLWL